MAQPALGATHDGRSEFFLDRPMGYFMLALFGLGLGLTVVGIDHAWHRGHFSSLVDYLAKYEASLRQYAFEVVTEVWLAFGLIKSRHWANVGLAFLGLSWICAALHYANLYSIFFDSVLVVYPVMRLAGSLGPKPRDEETSSEPFFLDRIAVAVSLCTMIVGVTLTVWSNINLWHRVQDMGTIGPIAFVLTRWWLHLRYIVELFLELWLLSAIRRSKWWAFVFLALLSASWLLDAIDRSQWFYIVDNGLSFAYPVARLLGWIGSPPRGSPTD